MLAILLCFALILFCVYSISYFVNEFKNTRDNAYIAFTGMFAAVLLFILYGFMHFKPWLN